MAGVYDTLMADAPYDKWAAFTKHLIHASGRSIQSIVDLGCGTGEIALRLAENDYRVTGVDFSADMLTLAAQKANERNLPVQWVHQDIREFTGFTEVDLAVCYCDTINYITSVEEIRAVFSRVASSLKEGGLFIFDVHSLTHMENNLKNQTFAEVTDDVSYIWFCIEGDHPGETFHELTFFSSVGDKYIRFDELHHQRTFSVEVYKNLLMEAGFRNIKMYGDFSLHQSAISEATERIFFAAEYNAGEK
jgi:ubiquinone/menaquinone biosynthesis C-methylase UbiE